MHSGMWRSHTVYSGMWRNHTAMGKLFHVSTLTRVHVCKSSCMRLGVSSINMCVHIAGRKEPMPFPTHKWNAKRWHQKRINWGIPNRGHVHKPRLVVNSNYDLQTVEKLLGLSLKQCFENFRLGVARASKKDHRSYAQVVAGQCDSNHMLQHKVHSDTVKQYSDSIQGQIVDNTVNSGLNHVIDVFLKYWLKRQ